MGFNFGHLLKHYATVTYRLSPFELNPLKGMLNPGFTEVCRRFGENIPTMAPPFLISYLIYQWGEHENHKLHRKNPADYANDV